MFDEKPQSSVQQVRHAASWLMFACRIFAVPMEAILHRQMGTSAIGLPGLASLFLIPVWASGYQGHSPAPMMWLWCLTLLAFAVRRMEAMRRTARGEYEHSRYTGWPIFKRLLPRCSEVSFKRAVEPFALFAIAVLVTPLNLPLAEYLMLSAIALCVSVNIAEAAEEAKAMQLNDALIAQRQTAERLRRMQGERW